MALFVAECAMLLCASKGDVMPNYTVRVELEGSPTREEYADLHERMKKLGFQQTVMGVSEGKNVIVQLPTGLYYGTSEDQTNTVSSNVYKAATAVRKVVGVFVAKTETWSSRP
jgi:hypothetical protein